MAEEAEEAAVTADDEPVTCEQRGHLMPPRPGKDEPWAALRDAHRTGGMTPGSAVPDISRSPSQVPDITKRALPAGSMPEDPFTAADAGSVALAESYWGMIHAGIPVHSAERIIGYWLASLPGDGKGDARER